MTLTQAIERAKSALEYRMFDLDASWIAQAATDSDRLAAEKHKRLDTEALQTLPEWKPEETI